MKTATACTSASTTARSAGAAGRGGVATGPAVSGPYQHHLSSSTSTNMYAGYAASSNPYSGSYYPAYYSQQQPYNTNYYDSNPYSQTSSQAQAATMHPTTQQSATAPTPAMAATTSQQHPPQHQHSDSVVDAYAQSVLESFASFNNDNRTSSFGADVVPDSSLGSYVTTMLRESESGEVDDESQEDGLVELLQDHCRLDAPDAKKALELIATAVKTGQVPTTVVGSGNTQQQQQPSSFLAMQTLQTALPTDSITSSDAAAAAAAAAALGVLSPLHEDKLIPENLLGDLLENVDASDPYSDQSNTPAFPVITGANVTGDVLSPSLAPSLAATHEEDFPPLGQATTATTSASTAASDDDFPTLGQALKQAPSSANRPRSNSMKAKVKKGKGSGKSIHASDLAASLFKSSTQPTPDEERQSTGGDYGSRQMYHTRHHSSQSRRTSSSSRSPNLKSVNKGSVSPLLAEGRSRSLSVAAEQGHENMSMYYPAEAAPPPPPEVFQSVVEILLSMNDDLGEDAAYEASNAANADINVAQYLVDRAMAQPPVCRHLLHDGCYRADCQYSHDLAGHTCMFWLRGRCGKGESCRFQHGYDENVVKEIVMNMQQQQHQMMQQQQQFGDHDPSAYGYTDYNDPTNPYNGMMYYENHSNGTYYGHQQNQYSIAQAPASAPSSFANIASQGYSVTSSFAGDTGVGAADPSRLLPSASLAAASTTKNIPIVRIPLDLWTPHEARDSSAFQIKDPMERYRFVMSLQAHRPDVIDLHFQSTKTFPAVLEQVLPGLLSRYEHEGENGVWIVTGTGHHVGTQTHQKSGGALETAVIDWLTEYGYKFSRGKDRNGQGGAVFVESVR